jgi:hypothetical protein
VSQYIHHVPGRLRVKTKAFYGHSAKVQVAQKTLQTLKGVLAVTVNPRAGSMTVHYDPKHCAQLDLLAVLERVGCLGNTRRNGEGAGQMGELVGKALFGALVQKTVERSVQSLVGALL